MAPSTLYFIRIFLSLALINLPRFLWKSLSFCFCFFNNHSLIIADFRYFLAVFVSFFRQCSLWSIFHTEFNVSYFFQQLKLFFFVRTKAQRKSCHNLCSIKWIFIKFIIYELQRIRLEPPIAVLGESFNSVLDSWRKMCIFLLLFWEEKRSVFYLYLSLLFPVYFLY